MNGPPLSGLQRNGESALLWGMALLAAMLSLLLWDVALSNDTQDILYHALRILQGGGLYVKWMELNPPLVYLIYCIPASLMLWLNIAPSHALYLFTWALCSWSVWMIRQSLKHASVPGYLRTRVLAASICMLFIISLSYGVFTDREHLLFILSLPWIVQMLFGLPARWSAILPAAIGFCIKPYNLLIPAALIVSSQRHLTWKQRLFSPSVWGIAAVITAYVALIYALFPNYLFHILPVIMIVYPALYVTPSVKLFTVFAFILLLIGPGIAGLRAPVFERRAWVGLMSGAVLCYWVYTYYLLVAPSVLALFCAESVVRFSDNSQILRIDLEK